MTDASPRPDWHIEIAPAKAVLLLVLVAMWGFAGVVLGLWYLGVGDVGLVAWALVLPFPVIISWSILAGLFAGNGRIRLEPDGFWRTVSDGRREFIRWDRVERFGTGLFGDPVETGTGVVVAEFSHTDEAGTHHIDRLANNLPYTGHVLAQVMEYARRQAALGWPAPPAGVADLAAAALDQTQ